MTKSPLFSGLILSPIVPISLLTSASPLQRSLTSAASIANALTFTQTRSTFVLLFAIARSFEALSYDGDLIYQSLPIVVNPKALG